MNNQNRRDTEGKIFGLQFLPQLAFVYLLNYGDKEQFGCIETLLIGIHNIEAKDTSSFRHVESLIFKKTNFLIRI